MWIYKYTAAVWGLSDFPEIGRLLPDLYVRLLCGGTLCRSGLKTATSGSFSTF